VGDQYSWKKNFMTEIERNSRLKVKHGEAKKTVNLVSPRVAPARMMQICGRVPACKLLQISKREPAEIECFETETKTQTAN
jgi:hypothetical protein